MFTLEELALARNQGTKILQNYSTKTFPSFQKENCWFWK